MHGSRDVQPHLRVRLGLVMSIPFTNDKVIRGEFSPIIPSCPSFLFFPATRCRRGRTGCSQEGLPRQGGATLGKRSPYKNWPQSTPQCPMSCEVRGNNKCQSRALLAIMPHLCSIVAANRTPRYLLESQAASADGRALSLVSHAVCVRTCPALLLLLPARHLP